MVGEDKIEYIAWRLNGHLYFFNNVMIGLIANNNFLLTKIQCFRLIAELEFSMPVKIRIIKDFSLI